MKQTTNDRRRKSESGRLGLCLAAVVICGTIIDGKSLAHHVLQINDFYVRANMSDPNETEANVCECGYWVYVEWWATTKNGDFDIEIWEPGTPSDDEDEDFRPPSGTKIAETSHTTSGRYTDSKLFEVTDSSALTTGEHSIRAWVIETSTSPPNAWEYSDDECTVFVAKGTEVEWETFPGNTDLDGCPKNGGKRIFPGKQTYNDEDAADRKKVTVKATITPAAADIKVYFSWWDVDDPCSDDPPLDDNDSNGPTGGDNNGSGASVPTYATTDASGVAKATFTVSMQPGDNFKITASTCEAKLGEVDQTDVDGNSLPECVIMTEMLTVWRKLHIERDSMEQVADSGDEDNWVRGGVDTSDFSYDSGNNETTIVLNQDLAACWEESKEYHFVGGEYKQCGVPWTPLRTVGHVGYDDIVVDGNAVVGWPCSYSLKDDDDTGLLPSPPDIGKCDDIFEDCYIDCVDDAPGGTNTVGFRRHVGSTVTYNSNIEAAAQRGSAGSEADNWWVVYVLSGYQGGFNNDYDPDTDSPAQCAVTHSTNFQISVTFRETMSDIAGAGAANLEQQSVVHEIGHQVLEEGDSAHTANTIMNAVLPVGAVDEHFSNAHIATIRGKTSAPGN
ncbi:MAG TPA: hypothetical protein VMX13_11190 [Sedimentisphaerales bacterium]|nr:hypothetical protein [Sedimentisphaerales bacterium]